MQNYIEQNGISSLAENLTANPNIGYKDVFYQLEQEIGADVAKVRALVQNKVITENQGQILMAQLAGKAQRLNSYRTSQLPQNVSNQSSPQTPMPPSRTPMEMFNQERPGFFEAEGRTDLLNYIKGFDIDKDELLQISKLVEGLEASAVDKYLKKTAHAKSLNDENKLAKSKLTSYAQNAYSANNMNRVFTREEIGNMSGEEFTKNEELIMEQLKQGLIK